MMDHVTHDNSWLETTVRLSYYFGEKKLFSVGFPALTLNVHFTKLMDNPLDSAIPYNQLPTYLQAVLVRSHPVKEHMPRLVYYPDFISYSPAQYKRFYIELKGRTFEDYLNKFSSKSRSTLLRKVRKFKQSCHGDIQWREYQKPEDMDDFYRLARDVSKKTYQEKLLDAGFPEGDEFRQKLKDLAVNNSARGYILFHDDKPIAYICCPAEERILLYQYVGYDPAFQALSPGTVLQYIVLEKLFKDNEWQLFDFTEGEGAHKEFFSTGYTYCADIYYIRRNLRNYLLLMLHARLSDLSSGAVSLLQKLGVKATIKKWLRRKA